MAPSPPANASSSARGAGIGTSQAPVREALRALEALGVVESGRIVRPCAVAHENCRNSDVRAELEGTPPVSPRRASRAGRPNSRLKLAMRHAAKAKDVRPSRSKTAFHRLIVAPRAIAFLLGIWSRLDVQTHTVMNVLRSHRDLMVVACRISRSSRRWEGGDARAARRATRAHILVYRLRSLTWTIIDNRSCDKPGAMLASAPGQRAAKRPGGGDMPESCHQGSPDARIAGNRGGGRSGAWPDAPPRAGQASGRPQLLDL